MKLNKIFMALAAMAMVGCSSEDVLDFGATQVAEDSNLIQLDENFVLAGVGEGDNVTRTHWVKDGSLKNVFLPILKVAPKMDDVLANDVDVLDQAVGLCWLGQGAVGTDVYTNYQFYHFGWLKTGESEAKIECSKLMNGALYDEIKFTADGGAAGEEANKANFAFVGTKDFAIGALNYNSGIYKTDNKAIFGGKYIVYYPFNEDFKEVGTIPALAETQFGDGTTTSAPKALTDPALGRATFRYSAPVDIEGGAQAGGFGLYNLSALVQLKVYAPKGDAALTDKIDKIILYSAKEQLLKQANLAADKIVAGKEGTELYTDETVGAKTITANFKSGDELVLNEEGSAQSAYITVLPKTVEDLVVYVHNSTQKKWATVKLNSTEFKANSAKLIKLSVGNSSFKADYIAVDEASLNTALTEASGKDVTIQVIGDITLTSDKTIDEPNITIKGDDIIVPEQVTLTLLYNIFSSLRYREPEVQSVERSLCQCYFPL